MEIMVALMLVALLFVSLPDSNFNSDREKLQQTIDLLRRAIRYSNNESVLRNNLVRMRFKLDTEPMKFKLEYATQKELVLPNFETDGSVSQEEERQNQEKSFNKKFSSIPEFEETVGEFNEDIAVVGIGTSLFKGLYTDKDSSIYFYPSGERDAALIILYSGQEFATLSIEPYSEKMKEHFEISNITNELSEDEQEQALQKRAKELYEQWLK